MYNIIVYVSKSWRFIGMETNNKNYAREQSNESSITLSDILRVLRKNLIQIPNKEEILIKNVLVQVM